MPAQAGAPRRAFDRLGRVVAVLLLAAAAVVAGAGAASAHASLVSSTPGAGAVVKAPLDAVRLTFTEAVSAPAYVVVTGPAGRADAGAAQVRGAVVSVGLRSDLAPGRYTVAYRVVSDDGHPLEDTFSFQLSAAAPATVTAGPSPSPSPLASAAPAAAAAAALPASSDHSGHWLMGFAGVAMVVAGAGALLYERHQRGAEDDPPIDPPFDPPFDTDESGSAGADGAPAGTTQDGIRKSQGGPS